MNKKILLEQEFKKTGAKFFLASMDDVHIKHLIQLAQVPNLIELMDWGGLFKIDETEKFIQAISLYGCPYSRKSEILLLGIYLEPEELPIGYVILKGLNMDLLTAEVGIAILDKKYRDKGYGRLALNRMIIYAFNKLKIKTIGATIISSNKQSINMCKNLGFFVREIMPKSWSMANGELVDMLWLELTPVKHKRL
ncbi:GNAT family N-acetyltransferase [Coleofasciculus chthonoplastes]|uniref:GNAT family N-acetyltransferase n=1 Tax=Coleofasciculus chthonoplastes TaxID=64178 RepID=UPI0032FCEC44